jgi:hypothetical protein
MTPFHEPIKMNIPNADDARRSIEKGEYEKAKKQAAEVEAQIINAIAQGFKIVSGKGWLEPAVHAKLEEMGYKYESKRDFGNSYWVVSWA